MEIAFEPYKKVSFQSYLPYKTAEEFVAVIASPNPADVTFQTRLFWANGVLFRFFNHAPSEALAKEIVSNGHLIFDHIEFAPMPNFSQVLRHSERPLGTVHVIDVSKHVVFGPLCKWIKENLIGK